jgi:cell fate (sporulation/competence/biofilm development) regulator YlbF (YheA/YmcA/DUF963 family)
MTKIIELAHSLGEEIAKSDEIKTLQSAKNAYDSDAALQAKMSEYETERQLLGQEFSKNTDDIDQKVVADLRARIEELTREICLELIEYITLDAYVEGQPRDIYIYYKLLDEPLNY